MKISFELEGKERLTALRIAEALENALLIETCKEVIAYLELIIKHKEQKYESEAKMIEEE